MANNTNVPDHRQILEAYQFTVLERAFLNCVLRSGLDDVSQLIVKKVKLEVQAIQAIHTLAQKPGDYTNFMDKVVRKELLSDLSREMDKIMKVDKSSATLLFRQWLDAMKSVQTSSTAEICNMLLWYEREHVLLFSMQDMAFQRLIRHVENSELQSFLARLMETAERKALHQMLGQSFKKDLANLESLVNLAALLSGFMAAWKIWLAKT